MCFINTSKNEPTTFERQDLHELFVAFRFYSDDGKMHRFHILVISCSCTRQIKFNLSEIAYNTLYHPNQLKHEISCNE